MIQGVAAEWSFSSLSANKGVNQRVMRFAPFITSKISLSLKTYRISFITIVVCIRESNNYHTIQI